MTNCTAPCCTLLTPPGPGAIAVIRVMGQAATDVVDTLFQPRNHLSWISTGKTRLSFGRVEVGGEIIDDAVVSRGVVDGVPFVDLCTHGGVRIVERTLTALTERGAPFIEMPLARAEAKTSIWQTGNLIEREAIAALGRALTARAVRFLSWQYSHLCATLNQLAMRCTTNADHAASELDQLIVGYKATHTLIHGIKVAIVGPPNAGKSTLFNRLVGRSAAVVSPIAGTTRDWIAQEIDLLGVPVTLIDTAGSHLKPEPLEQEAINAAVGAAALADLRLLVLDGSTAPPDPRESFSRFQGGSAALLTVISKCDLPLQWGPAETDASNETSMPSLIRVSASTGHGIPDLIRAILTSCGAEPDFTPRPALFTRRQWVLACQIRSLLVEQPEQSRRRIEQELIGPS